MTPGHTTDQTPAASPVLLAPEVPYFDPPALRELAARARRFAETLSPAYRQIMIEKAQRLERQAAREEGTTVTRF